MEWAKSLARAERWEEELKLLKTEMVRSLKYLECMSVSWLSLCKERTGLPPDIGAGISGYAHKQSYLFHQMARKFAALWIDAFRLCKQKLPRAWPVPYRAVTHSRTQIQRRPHRQNAHIRLQNDAAMEVDT